MDIYTSNDHSLSYQALNLPEIPERLYKAVYWLETKEGYVKIGITNDIVRRKKEIEKEFKIQIKRIRFSNTCNAAKMIESALHDIFADNWIGGLYGEWFDVDYDKVTRAATNLIYWVSHFAEYRE